jgi:hypothetical protein
VRRLLVALAVALCPIVPAQAQINIEFGAHGVSIGIDVPVYPQLVRVPGYPVYYDPRASSNYFFYDGLYWVYQSDNWYASSWYNGPWDLVSPNDVPLYLLRVPVRYYREPPTYFAGWVASAPPRWGEHWGSAWEERRSGWDQWNHGSVPAPAPLPTYQKQYSGDRYPHAPDQQVTIRDRNYRYQPREAVAQQQFHRQAAPAASSVQSHPQAPAQRQAVARQNPQPNEPRQQSQPMQSRPVQAAQQTQHQQPAQQAQHQLPPQQEQPARAPPRQPPAQAQHGAEAHQDKGQEKNIAQGQGQENGAPHGKGQEKDTAQGKGEESRSEERSQPEKTR